MKRKKERTAILEGKISQDESSYRIQDTKNLLNRVARIKSQQKDHCSNSVPKQRGTRFIRETIII